MTPQEIDRIQCAIRHIKTSVDVDEWAVEIAVDAMKKQIPKKPTLDKGWLYCSVCGKDILMEGYKFCPDCGQAIDWSEEG